jgi:glycine cleavage system H lipoate-binding protein
VSAPDLFEPILGFRAWHVVADGRLVPWSAGTAGTWQPGDNRAICLAARGGRHQAPGHRCTCGLYALTDVSDPRLRPGVEAVGAVVAWGDVEAHRTGFRAQFARVVALAEPPLCPPEHTRLLELAAERYGVPLVAFGQLEATGREHGRPLEFDLLPHRPQGRGVAEVPGLDETGERAICVDEHLRVEIATRVLRVRLTDQLAARLQAGVQIDVAPPGCDLRMGDPLVRITGEHTYVLGAPVSGRVVASAAAVCELAPSRWAEEAGSLSWGVGGERTYRATLAHAARHGDPFRHSRTTWTTAHAHVRSAGDVAAELRAARTRPRFASAAEVAERVGGGLRAALGDPAVGRRVVRAGVAIAWRLHRPDADVVLHLDGTEPRVEVGELDIDAADLVLFASAESADDYFAGRADLPAALRRRDVQTRAEPGELLRVASVIKAIHRPYASFRLAQEPGA